MTDQIKKATDEEIRGSILKQDLRANSERVHGRHSSALARVAEINKIISDYDNGDKTNRTGQALKTLKLHLEGDLAMLEALAQNMKSAVERLDAMTLQEGPRHVMTKEDSRLFSKALDTPPKLRSVRAAEAYHQRVASAD